MRARRTALMLVALLVCEASFALDPAKSVQQYVHRKWGAEEGLASASIRPIAQTSDGFLWLGTLDGLIRFDGMEFTVVSSENTPAFTSNTIRSLSAFGEELWIGTADGVVRQRGGVFTRLVLPKRLTIGITRVAKTSDGAVWGGVSGGVMFRLASGALTVFDQKDGIRGTEIQAIHQDAHGVLWVATNEAVCRVDGRRFQALALPPPFDKVSARAIASWRGSLWMGTEHGVLRIDGGAVTPHAHPELKSAVWALTVDRHDNLWIATSSGVYRDNGATVERFDSSLGLTDDVAVSLFEDREGSLWIGTQTGGLNQLRDAMFTTLGAREGLPTGIAWSVAEDSDGGVWFGTNGGGAARLHGGRWTTYTSKQGLSGDIIISVLPAPNGDVWMGTHAFGLCRLRGGTLDCFRMRDGLPSDMIVALALDRQGTVWAATTRGAARFDGRRFVSYGVDDGLAAAQVLAFHTDHRGRMLVGTVLGLSVRTGERFEKRAAPFEPRFATTYVFEEDANGDVWIGTEVGLERLRGETRRLLAKKHGVPSQIMQVRADGHGNLWLATGRGLLRAKLSDLNAAADGIRQHVPLTRFTRADGLRSNDCVGGAQPGVLRSSDGRLWIPTAKGVSVVDPGAKTTSSWHAPITVTNVRIDGASAPQAKPITVPAGAKRLQIHMIAPTFIAPEEAEYEYKLEGFDNRWIATNPKGIAQFTQLRGGDYEFSARMRRRSDEPWIQLATPLAIHVETPYYRSLPFYALLALAALAVAWLLQRMRLRRLSRRYGLILAERIRIARDVHDALSQDFFAIRLQLTALGQAMQDASAEADRHLRKAMELTSHANEEARRIVHGLHDAAGERATLADALRAIVAEMRAGVSEGIDLTIADGDPLPPHIENALLPIAREAMTNAVRHAHATRIVVEVHRAGRTIRLRVADNGIGVGPDALDAPADHVGIRSMRERAAQIGGKIDFRKAAEGGAEVVVAVKVPFFSWLRARLLGKRA